jgi:hypothetical protein
MKSKKLPQKLKPYFWEYTFSELTLDSDHELIIRRILTNGSWDALQWLRSKFGDLYLRNWLMTHKGRGLSPRQMRFWELVLNLPHKEVNQWVQDVKSTVWGQK